MHPYLLFESSVVLRHLLVITEFFLRNKKFHHYKLFLPVGHFIAFHNAAAGKCHKMAVPERLLL